MAAAPTPEPFPARFWSRLEDGRAECGVCPRRCRLRPGQRGFCGIRGNLDGTLVLLAYGRASGFCIDPIEKKPLNHFLPGTPVLSFGTAGCNLGCRFCQNWDLSHSRDPEALLAPAPPEAVARAARARGCRSVAFTYNEPVVAHEYCVDTALACREQGVRTVAVSAGYQCAGPREELCRHLDAANIDLKGFSDAFYRRLCGARLQPVLETLEYLRRETRVWLEITTLVIPGANDAPAELAALADWIVDRLGPDVPLHFSAFHPAWKLLDVPPTPLATLREARRIARDRGLRHVYLGNVPGREGADTHCRACGHLLIGRRGYDLAEWGLTPQGSCAQCGTPCPGVFEARPGRWGGRREPIRVTP
ncbi:MAG: AmmeMemoRadiSam system radical SAM enzyme [Holophaga sp.]|jgi:pyruvate formate lyase activating enzyme